MALIFDEIRKFKNVDFLSRSAADFICRLSGRVLQKQRIFTLALSGGTTPLTLYKLLSKKPYRNAIDWKKVHLFWVDERFVPENNPENNFGSFCKVFKCRGKLPCSNLHKIDTAFKTAAQSAENYEKLLKRFFGRTPQFDLAILGMGSDGHTASLFPGNKALRERKKRVVSVRQAKAKIKERITLALFTLNNSKNVLLLVTGKSKEHILRRTLNIKKPTYQYPLSFLRPRGGIFLFTDLDV
jgi:6-phosphogluconolactonase